MPATPPSRLQLAGAVALLLGSLAVFAAQCAGNPAIPFIVQDPAAPWIAFPAPPDGMLGLAPRNALPVTRFERGFEVPPSGAGSALLEVRALRSLRVWLDGAPVALPDAGQWRNPRRVQLPELAPGPHALRVDVTNPTGPALLALRAGALVTSDGAWRVSRDGGPPRAAVLVDTTRVIPGGFAMPTPAEGLAARRNWVLASFALSAGLFLALRRRALGGAAAVALPVLIVVVWLGPLARNALAIPRDVGFDARHHIEYVEFLREHRHLPVATDGWSMFHPPLYYAATALLVELADADARWGWKLVGVLAGLGSALGCLALAAALHGRRSRETALAGLLAGTLPMNAYVSSYVTNESLHAALATTLAWATVRLLLARETSRRALLGWAALVAAAALTKYTAWIVACVAGFFLCVKWWRIERAGAGELARRVGLAAACVAALAGWFAVRALATSGQLFPLNVDLPGETQVWWSQPGFYTPAFFSEFGAVLRHPFLAGTHSAWDAFYSTLWGDGQLAGQMLARLRHPYWDWELMAAGYALALPASLLIVLGAARACRLALREPDPHRRAAYSFVCTLAWALLLSVLYMTLRQPDYGLAKAFYGLAGMAPLTLFFGLGAGAADRWLEARAPVAVRAVCYGWLGSFVTACFAPYLL